MDLPGFIRRERIHFLKKSHLNSKGEYVLYFMEASQRSKYNYALEASIHFANSLKKPILVYFGITDRYKFSNLRYYTFMLQGIMKVRESLKERGLRLIILKEDPPDGAIKLSRKASLLVVDRGYLRHQREWRKRIVEEVDIPVIEVEGDVVLPVESVSLRLHNSARVVRHRLKSLLSYFLEDLESLEPKLSSVSVGPYGWQRESHADYLQELDIDKTVNPVDHFLGGEDEAQKRLERFVEERLDRYLSLRTDPGVNVTSELSPYLRFGQISPGYVARFVLKHRDLQDPNVAAFLDQLIVWRETARNYAWYNPLYNEYYGLPKWARKTLEDHLSDPRQRIYDLKDLESAKTEDPYWNIAQRELLEKGTIHNYLRMYWCKRLIEWTIHPRIAFDFACYLNDKYAIDGRDPNGYLGISWCFGALDRPYPERPVFGRVRKMTEKALLSKPNFRYGIRS